MPTVDNGRILIATNCVTNNTLFPIYEKVRFISDEIYHTWFRGHPTPGDILFVNKGTPGRVCLVPDPIDFSIAQDMIALRADDTKVYNKYLLAVLRSDRIQRQIYNTSVGDVIPHFKKQFLNQLLIPIPDRKVQEFIGDLYYNLSYKVEHNNRINHNLEEQAQALYKSWFVDFEPFQEGEFVESELGLIPKGWKVVSLDSLCSIISRGFSPKYSESTTDVVLGQRCVRNNMIDLSVSKTHVPKNLGERALCRYDILINSTGMGSLGRVAQIYFKPERMTYDSHLTLVRAKSSTLEMYLGRNLLSRQDEIENMAVGSTGQTELPRESVKAMSILLPCDTVLDQFGASIRAIAGRIQSNLEENVGLTAMRDYLLPKLMSGELKINDLDC